MKVRRSSPPRSRTTRTNRLTTSLAGLFTFRFRRNSRLFLRAQGWESTMVPGPFSGGKEVLAQTAGRSSVKVETNQTRHENDKYRPLPLDPAGRGGHRVGGR